ncbi:ORF275 [White spot syndrome virus]|uniref:Wsv233 n=3 Tax=White spot syndrome virus TaxID=342409 RepID=Q8VAY5_WSSVS|nr:wsv233 [Shrimp white spot syndrome virus]AFX59610.1 wsv233 [White spot syndrome virus]AAL33237.1 wsv233 [Shrimp white spot syndrome virus]AAL89156.1 WSSV288 [Shrimp white spot syndrome virus]ATU84071.1 ORF275 [White spot syndrome virus]AWQ60404.1 wsv233 [Shrimp white spot syndrome virus]
MELPLLFNFKLGHIFFIKFLRRRDVYPLPILIDGAIIHKDSDIRTCHFLYNTLQIFITWRGLENYT